MKEMSSGFSARGFSAVLVWVEWLCVAVLAVVLLQKGIAPGWHVLNTDFPNYYLVARLLREGYGLDRIYDWIWLQRVKDHWGLDQPLVGFAGLTPLSALPVLPIAGLPALVAKRVWMVANVAFLFGTIEALRHTTQLKRRWLWIVCLLCVLPLRTSFLFGQMHILVLFLLAAGYFFRNTKRGILCGICLALAGALKIYPLLFVFYFAWKRQWREAMSLVFATAALVGVDYLCFGSHVMHTYVAQVLPRSMQGEMLDPYNTQFASAATFFHRLFLLEPDLNPLPVRNNPLLYAIVYPLWQAALLLPMFLSLREAADDGSREKLEWAAFLTLLLVLSPVPSSYHFVVLMLPAVLMTDVFVKRRAWGWLAAALLLYVLMCNDAVSRFAHPGDRFSFATVVAFSRLWLGVALWAIPILHLWRERRKRDRQEPNRLRAAGLAAVVVAFWVVGFLGYRRHFVHRDEDLQARLKTPIQALLMTDVHATADGFMGIAMTPQGYRLVDQLGRMILPATSDQLSSSAVPGSRAEFGELADASGSRIVLRDSTTFAIANAESPAMAADGSALAYIREEKGRGSLWMDRLDWTSKSPVVRSDTELVGGEYDVRDVSFAVPGYLVFTARVHGRTGIYRMTPGGMPSVLVSDERDVDSGAVSPDEQWLLFRRLVRDRWQLVMMHPGTREEKQLTFSDCNAFSPAWLRERTVVYATDCERGMGLTALATLDVGSVLAVKR